MLKLYNGSTNKAVERSPEPNCCSMVVHDHPTTPFGVAVPFGVAAELVPFADWRRLAGSLFSCQAAVVSIDHEVWKGKAA